MPAEITQNPLVEALKPSYIREILQASAKPNMVSLAGGLPAPELFPMDLVQSSLAEVAQVADYFQYASTEGDASLRHWIAAAWSTPINKCADENVLITSGSQQALDLIARAYIVPGDKVLVESPCYLGALQVFRLAGAEIITIDQHEDGPDLKQLEQALALGPKLFYTVPDFHNPTGVCWSLEKRQQAAALLNQHRIAIIEDAPYRELRYEGQDLPQLAEFIQNPVFRLGSFSKIVTPGIRLGFVIANQDLLAPLATIKQAADLHSSHPLQHMILAVVNAPEFEHHLARVRAEYRRRRDHLCALLQHHFGSDIHFSRPDGGMFLWLTFNGYCSDKIAAKALICGVTVVPGSAFLNEEGIVSNSLRLNFSYESEQNLSEGVLRLRSAVYAKD